MLLVGELHHLSNNHKPPMGRGPAAITPGGRVAAACGTAAAGSCGGAPSASSQPSTPDHLKRGCIIGASMGGPGKPIGAPANGPIGPPWWGRPWIMPATRSFQFSNGHARHGACKGEFYTLNGLAPDSTQRGRSQMAKYSISLIPDRKKGLARKTPKFKQSELFLPEDLVHILIERVLFHA